MGPPIHCGLQEAIFLHQQMVEKLNIYFFMQISVFKVIYLPNQINVLNRKIVKELINSRAFSVQKNKNYRGFKCNSRNTKCTLVFGYCHLNMWDVSALEKCDPRKQIGALSRKI